MNICEHVYMCFLISLSLLFMHNSFAIFKPLMTFLHFDECRESKEMMAFQETPADLVLMAVRENLASAEMALLVTSNVFLTLSPFTGISFFFLVNGNTQQAQCALFRVCIP